MTYTPMPSDPPEAFRFGVEQATEPLPRYVLGSMLYSATETVNKELADRRKKLLPKKVTKWVNVYADEGGLESSGNLYDSKIAAEMGVGRAVYTSKHVGTYPIEIEVPL